MKKTTTEIVDTKTVQLPAAAAQMPAWITRLDESKPSQPESAFMPYAFIASSKAPAPQKAQHMYVMAQNLVELEASVQLVWFASRKATRELVGSRYKNRAYLGGKTNQEYLDALEGLQADEIELGAGESDIQSGETALVYLESKTFSGFVTVECFGRAGDVWSVWFNGGYWRDGNCCEIGSTDLKAALVISKSGNEYLSSWKVKAWSSKKIADDMAARILEAGQACQKQADYYFSM